MARGRRAQVLAMLNESQRLEGELADLISQLVSFTQELTAATTEGDGDPDAAKR